MFVQVCVCLYIYMCVCLYVCVCVCTCVLCVSLYTIYEPNFFYYCGYRYGVGAKDWEVVNRHGKKVDIPRPVEALRVWDAEKRVLGSQSPCQCLVRLALIYTCRKEVEFCNEAMPCIKLFSSVDCSI